MSWIEIWERIALPIIQFLIGPILAAYVVYKLTNSKNNRNEKEDRIRQMNTIRSKLNRAINFIVLTKDEDRKFDEIALLIDKMENGDFTGITHDKLNSENVTQEDFSDIIEEYYYDKNQIFEKRDSHVKNYLSTIEDIKNSPKDKLPTTVHDKLVRIIDNQSIKIDIEEYKELIDEINKLT